MAFLCLVSIGILADFNLRQQLTRGQLEAARSLWHEKGPRDYDMEYTQERTVEDKDKYVVRVRDGRVVFAERNGRPLEREEQQPGESDLLQYSSMPALFGFIEGFLVMDAKPDSPRTFTIASFDPDNGRLKHYVRRVMGATQRVEITVHQFNRRNDE